VTVPDVAFPYGAGEIEASFDDAGTFRVRLGALKDSGADLQVVLGFLLDAEPRSPHIRALAGEILEALLIEAQLGRRSRLRTANRR